MSHSLGIAVLMRATRSPSAAGLGHVEDANIRKAMAEKARLEAELDNSRFAAAPE
jgi:indolepyruvate ferredoxin oxidoreductase